MSLPEQAVQLETDGVRRYRSSATAPRRAKRRLLALSVLGALCALPGCGRVAYRPTDAGPVDAHVSSIDAHVSSIDAHADSIDALAAGPDAVMRVSAEDVGASPDASTEPPDAFVVPDSPGDGGGPRRSLTSSSISSSVADCSPITVSSRGEGFVAGIEVFLLDSSGARFDATAVTVSSPTDLGASVVLAGAALGPAELHVLWPTGEERIGAGYSITSSPYAGAVFVDGDASGLSDGSRARPFATINAGIGGARASGVVLVDGSSTPYAAFTLASNTTVAGCVWSGAGARPRVAIGGRHVLATATTNVTLERLDFELTLGAAVDGLVISRGNGVRFRDCGFSGTATGADANFVVVQDANDVEIADSWFHTLHHVAAPTGTRLMSVLRALGTQGFHLHHSEFSDIGFSVAGGPATSELDVVQVRAGAAMPHDVRVHHVLAHDVFGRSDGVTYLTVFQMGNVNSFDWVGVFEFYDVTIDDLRHADPPGSTVVTGGHVNGFYFGTCGGTRDWRDNIAAHLVETDEAMMAGSSSYYGFWVDGFLMPGPSPQPMASSLVYDVGSPLPMGANSFGWSSGFVNQVTAGTGSLRNSDAVDPMFDLTPGPNYYHPTNPRIARGGSDGGEIGAFGGGTWTPPSQRPR